MFYKGRKVTSRVPRRRASESLGEYYPGSVDGPAEVRPVAECPTWPRADPPGIISHLPKSGIGRGICAEFCGDSSGIGPRSTFKFSKLSLQVRQAATCAILRVSDVRTQAQLGAWAFPAAGKGSN